MQKIFLLILLAPLSLNAQSYLKLHNKAIVIDTHNDFVSAAIEKKVNFDEHLNGKTHTDIYA
jgi:membrane dipeptidase